MFFSRGGRFRSKGGASRLRRLAAKNVAHNNCVTLMTTQPCHQNNYVKQKVELVNSKDGKATTWGFPKIRGTILGVPKIRTIVYWGLYWGPPI